VTPTPPDAAAPLHREVVDDGQAWRVRLDAGKGNVLDGRVVAALHDVFRRAAADRDVKAVCLEAAGPHFCFGASVEEHLPGRAAEMLRALHGLFRAMLDAAVVVTAAVRGRCLGGGLELVSLAHRVVADPSARLGQPEIVLGVLAPTASVLLPERLGRGAAEDLCLTGRTVTAEEALALGLVDAVGHDPEAAALGWVREHFLPRSASSLRHAVRAIRLPLVHRLDRDLAAVERLYLEDLMGSHDAEEGLRAFLEKRAPVWRNA
jgi:cyclohexa-1,5-dienecarbonyl-CoA hydratase